MVLLLYGQLSSQSKNPFLILEKDHLEIPFKFINGLILIEAKLQNKIPVNLLVDTGAENLILFNKSITERLGVSSSKGITMRGADLNYQVTAEIYRNISLTLPEGLALNRDFIVLDDNFLKLDEALGVRVDGLIGGRLFRGLVMEIDYEKQKIKLINKGAYRPSKSPHVERLEFEIVNNKPYITASLTMYMGSSIPIKLLLDTGSSIGLLLFLQTHPELLLPEVHLEGPLGRGLGGDIIGYRAKTKTLRINNSLFFNNLVTSFQNTSESIDPSYYNDRNGILGNPLLSKFKVTIDYVDQLLYLAPIKNYNKDLAVDKSGMIVFASGPKLSDYVVKYVFPNTPADEAGIRVGDLIKRIGWMPSNLLTLSNVNNKFARKEGKTLRFNLKRDGETIRTKLTLRDYLYVEALHWNF